MHFKEWTHYHFNDAAFWKMESPFAFCVDLFLKAIERGVPFFLVLLPTSSVLDAAAGAGGRFNLLNGEAERCAAWFDDRRVEVGEADLFLVFPSRVRLFERLFERPFWPQRLGRIPCSRPDLSDRFRLGCSPP